MNETSATYMDIKHPPSKKRTPKKKIKEETVYTEVTTCTSNSNQTKIPKMKSSTEKGSPGPFVWHLTVVILGILCFFLLVTSAVLGFIVFQGHETYQTQKLLLDNRTQQVKSTFKDMTTTEFPLDTGHKKDVCKTQWSCCGDKCYHFSREFKTFQESKTICKSMSATLVKIEDENELNFMQIQMSYFSWIGLSRKGTSSSWKWEDNSTPSLQVMPNWRESKGKNCASISRTRIIASDCSKSQLFICEKRFPYVATS